MKPKIIDERNNEVETGRFIAIFSYIPFLCFIPLLNSSKNEFAQKHAKQGLLLLIIEVVALFFLIDVISQLFWILVLFICVIFAVIGIFMALLDKTWKIPLIGNIFEKYEV